MYLKEEFSKIAETRLFQLGKPALYWRLFLKKSISLASMSCFQRMTVTSRNYVVGIVMSQFTTI